MQKISFAMLAMMMHLTLRISLATLFILALLLPQQSHAKKRKKERNKNRKVTHQINKQREKCQEICAERNSLEDEQQQTQTYDPFSAESMACVTRCMSAECHEEIYKEDELEDGEVDKLRNSAFNDCMRTDLPKRDRSTWL